VTSVQSVAVLRPPAGPIAGDDLAPDCQWRAVCEYPGITPVQMAVEAGRAALTAADDDAEKVQWLLHAGVGPQGNDGRSVHHDIRNGVIGRDGNALELKQNCAGGLTSWLMAARLLDDAGLSICTGADNWSWCDRFANSRALGGEPYSDVAHATVLSHRGGFAELMGSASGSCPEQADDWRIHEAYWESTGEDDFQSAYTRATAARSDESLRESCRMFACVAKTALADARLSPQHVTHFVPQGSASGQPFLSLARRIGLPWSASLHQHTLDHGYLGVSTHADGLVHLAETGGLRRDSIVLLLAAEYQLSATAIVLRVLRAPRVWQDGMTRVIA
jgi:3-oxoacyl-[acyl-carrier-protein] synthase III